MFRICNRYWKRFIRSYEGHIYYSGYKTTVYLHGFRWLEGHKSYTSLLPLLLSDLTTYKKICLALYCIDRIHVYPAVLTTKCTDGGAVNPGELKSLDLGTLWRIQWVYNVFGRTKLFLHLLWSFTVFNHYRLEGWWWYKTLLFELLSSCLLLWSHLHDIFILYRLFSSICVIWLTSTVTAVNMTFKILQYTSR